MTVYHTLPEKCPVQSADTAVAIGMFDGLHRGHMKVLNALVERLDEADEKQFGNKKPPVSQNQGRIVFTFATNSGRPDSKTSGHILSERSRDAILEDMGIDCVFEPEFSDFRDMSPETFVKDFLCGYLNARFVFCGEDFRFGKNASASAGDLRLLLPEGARARIIPLVRDDGGAISTTRIRALVQSGDMQNAARLLGRPFSIDFSIEHGRRLGRELGVPTINQAFPDDFVRPRFGVYASETVIADKRYASVTNVGVKPTVGSDRVLAETYIEGFSGDLYGQNIPVEFAAFIRDERKFESVDDLFAQIREDIVKSVNIVNK